MVVVPLDRVDVNVFDASAQAWQRYW